MSNKTVTIVMYHYVRDLHNSRYPEIKGLDIELFKEQLKYFKKHYNFITMEDLLMSVNNKFNLPKKAILLTFDDAYIDHYTHVFPVLIEQKVQGSFFIPVKTCMDNKVLDVNKIHFILASCNNLNELINDIYKQLDLHRAFYNLNSNQFYYTKLARSNRFDNEQVIFIKRLLQVELNYEVRNIITNILFDKYVKVTEKTFARELYLNFDQIKTMKNFGMHIGAHGYDHFWFESLTEQQQEYEISKSYDFLKNLNVPDSQLTICYPYGSYNNDTQELLKKYKFNIGFTTEVAKADISFNNKYFLPRLDTNDFPKNSNSPLN